MGLWGKDMELVLKGRKGRAPRERLVIAKGCIAESFLEEGVAELSLAQGTHSIASTAVVIHSRRRGVTRKAAMSAGPSLSAGTAGRKGRQFSVAGEGGRHDGGR